MPKRSTKSPSADTTVADSLSALYARRGAAGLNILSAVSGISVARLNELRSGQTPDLMEGITLTSLASFS